MNTSIIDRVVEQLKVMPQQKQWQVLQFTETLLKAEVQGTPGNCYVLLVQFPPTSFN